MKTFTLDKYTLNQIHEAYHGYVSIEKVLMYGVKGSIKYDEEFSKIKLKIEAEKVIEEMRKYPEFKDVMPILDQPSCLALIKMITCFRKFNFEHEDTHVNDIVSFDQGAWPIKTSSELQLSNERIWRH